MQEEPKIKKQVKMIQPKITTFFRRKNEKVMIQLKINTFFKLLTEKKRSKQPIQQQMKRRKMIQELMFRFIDPLSFEEPEPNLDPLAYRVYYKDP